MVKFSVTNYNRLPLIAVAHGRFELQLASAGLTRDELFSELTPIFLEEENRGKYAIYLIHRHYSLKQGEHMVTTDNISKPTTVDSHKIIPERWLSNGKEIEHRFVGYTTSVPPPPSPQFLSKFKSIVDRYGVNMLGVCYAPCVDELAPGFVFLESAGPGDREQITIIVADSSIINATNTYQSAWIPTYNGCRSTMNCTHNCVDCPP